MPLAHEPQIAGRKIRQVRENGRQVRRTDSKPSRQRRRILVQRRSGDPPAISNDAGRVKSYFKFFYFAYH